jgi:hypothetical protein
MKYVTAISRLGSASVSRAGFGVAPEQAFRQIHNLAPDHAFRKVRDGEDAVASTRDARATQRKDDTLDRHAS